MFKMITCRQASHLLSERQDRPLGWGERASLRLHLALCAPCVRAAEQIEFLRRAMARYVGRDPGPGQGPPD
ncbi:MAG: zf-HC2 domain-containing protein [Burkholderiales bacterium]|nr:zf-HC2 domain-containing protein [Burkholderiales bacterium]